MKVAIPLFAKSALQLACLPGFLFTLMACGPPSALAQMSPLHTKGRSIVDATGQTVQLQGVNLGGWLVMEPWMTPADSGGSPDMYSILAKLDKRFGVAEEQRLIKTYQQNWITTQDLANIKAAGFNTVRVPVWWGNFYPIANISNSGWRSDAWTQLDWLVDNAATYGLYVIIDMHGLVGSQSTSMDTGQENKNSYWTNGGDQGNSSFMWWQIANHFKGNPAVAGYDLINEPTGAPNNDAVINAYASLYKTVRSADPNHMIFLEGAWGSWNWGMLPAPTTKGWTNVVYEMHEYQFNGSPAKVTQGSTNQVTDFNSHTAYDCPGYIGEFNDMSNSASVWKSSIDAYTAAGLSWTMWSYKSSNAVNPNFWGLYGPTHLSTVPNIATDTADIIASDWEAWSTAATFARNTELSISGTVNSTSFAASSWYKLINDASHLCVDAKDWGTTNGTVVDQYTCGQSQTNQQWQFVPKGGGSYAIFNHNAPDQAINVVNSDNKSVQTWAFGGGANERWTLVPLGKGSYKIVGVAGGQCLQVPNASTANSVQLIVGTCNGLPSQSFSLTEP